MSKAKLMNLCPISYQSDGELGGLYRVPMHVQNSKVTIQESATSRIFLPLAELPADVKSKLAVISSSGVQAGDNMDYSPTYAYLVKESFIDSAPYAVKSIGWRWGHHWYTVITSSENVDVMLVRGKEITNA